MAEHWTDGLDLPGEVLEMADFSPLEDVLLYVLRNELPSVPSYSLIPEQAPPLFILVRKDHSMGEWRGDARFLNYGRLRVDVFATDPDGDERAAVVSEAIRRVFLKARQSNYHIPGRGWISRLVMQAEPSRKTDWATAAGPIQYADLPTGYWRYESKYDLLLRVQGHSPAEDDNP